MYRNLSREAHIWYTILSPDYMATAKPLFEQAYEVMMRRVRGDAVAPHVAPIPYWGGKVEEAVKHFDAALALYRAGNFDGMLTIKGGVSDALRGFTETYVTWLGDEQDLFFKLLNDGNRPLSHGLYVRQMQTQFQSDRYLRRGLTDWATELPEDDAIPSWKILNFEDEVFSSLPTQIPEYGADTSVTCVTGQIVPWTGMWVPARGMGTAALAYAEQGLQIMQPAYEVAEWDDDGYGIKSYFPEDVVWHPVKPTGRMISYPKGECLAGGQLRCESGRPCPVPGYWFTPARANSRRRFEGDEVMPNVGGDFGATIWQWDLDQRS